MRRLLLSVLAVVAIGVGLAVAQNVQRSLNGLETWEAGIGGPSGSGVFTNTQAMRGGRTYANIGAGTTITQVVSPGVDTVLITGAITTLQLSLPVAPFDQQTLTIACPGGIVSTLTLSVGVASSPSTLVGTGLSAGGNMASAGAAGACTNTVVSSASMTLVASASAASAGGGVVWQQIK